MRWVSWLVADWRSGTRRSQLLVLGALVVGVAVTFAVSLHHYDLFPLAGYFLWLLVGTLLLRFVPLVAFAGFVSLTAVVARLDQPQVTGGRTASLVILALCVALVLYASRMRRSGLPAPVSEALLSDLRDRLNGLGRVPVLPAGWSAQSAMVAAYGVGYAGDFMVAHLDEDDRLDLVLVDVVGKGVKAAPASLLLAGALGGLVGSVRGRHLLDAANDFLLRQDGDETFATAVHVEVDLRSGAYAILSAGHPPALHWDPAHRAWDVDNSRGLALGIMAHPELHASEGVLGPGEALLFYTDGVVESRDADLDVGIDWLRGVAQRAFLRGQDGAARRIIKQVSRGDDDRAVLILSRAG